MSIQFVVLESEEEQARELQKPPSHGSAALIAPTGERLDLPETIYRVLKHAVNIMQHARILSNCWSQSSSPFIKLAAIGEFISVMCESS